MYDEAAGYRSDIFIPLIPGIIAAGLCGGLASLIEQVVLSNHDIVWITLLCQLLLEADLDMIRALGHSDMIIVAVLQQGAG